MDVAKTNRDPCYTISTSSWDGIHTTTTTPNWRKINLEILLTDNIIIITLKPPQKWDLFLPNYIFFHFSSCVVYFIVNLVMYNHNNNTTSLSLYLDCYYGLSCLGLWCENHWEMISLYIRAECLSNLVERYCSLILLHNHLIDKQRNDRVQHKTKQTKQKRNIYADVRV